MISAAQSECRYENRKTLQAVRTNSLGGFFWNEMTPDFRQRLPPCSVDSHEASTEDRAFFQYSDLIQQSFLKYLVAEIRAGFADHDSSGA